MKKYTFSLTIFLKTILQVLALIFCAYFFIKSRLYGFFVDAPQIIDDHYIPAFIASVVVFATFTSVVRDYTATINIKSVDKAE